LLIVVVIIDTVIVILIVIIDYFIKNIGTKQTSILIMNIIEPLLEPLLPSDCKAVIQELFRESLQSPGSSQSPESPQEGLTVSDIQYIGLTDDYVYDLETLDGTFAASSFPDLLRDILCKNTDSCYVAFNLSKEPFTDENGYYDEVAYMKEIFRISKECAEKISKRFKSPIKLEFEKVMFPFFLYAKKRYAYKEWICAEKPNNVEYKGLSLVRRDYCPYVKDVCDRIFRILMNDKNSIKEITEFTDTDGEQYIKIVEYVKEEEKIQKIETYFDSEGTLCSRTVEVDEEAEGQEGQEGQEFQNGQDGSEVQNGHDVKKENVIIFKNEALKNINTKSEHKIAILYTRKVIADLLLNNNVPLKDLVISKSITNKYKLKGMDIKWTMGICSVCMIQKKSGEACPECPRCNDPKFGIKKFFKSDKNAVRECQDCKNNYVVLTQPHVRVANRLRAKDPINGPKPPDRIPFVFVRVDKWERKKQYEFAYHPSELTEDMKINHLYYFLHQLKNSIDQIFSVLEDNPSNIYKDILEECINRYNNQQKLNFESSGSSEININSIDSIAEHLQKEVYDDDDSDNNDYDDCDVDL
jgi:hypothetical protein